MYRAFNLTQCKWSDFPVEEGSALNESNSNIVGKALKDFLDNGKIDGTKMRDHWFPEIQVDVWEDAKLHGADSVKRLINANLDGTTVT